MFVRAVVLALPFVAQAFAKECTRKYTVKEGDICDGISAAHNVSTYQLSAINPSIDDTCSNLVPGSTLCLGYTGEDCSTTYTVVADNTCEGIAAKHNINSTILFANNPQLEKDCNNLYIGEVLCVNGNVQVPPAPAGHTPGAVIPTTAAPANPHQTKTAHVTSYLTITSAPTAAPSGHNLAPKPTTTPAPAPPAQGGENDEDDEDLPFCDEL